MTIPLHEGDLPWLTAEQMREVDRLMMVEYGIGLVSMMENAGRNLACLARERFPGGDPGGRVVAVLTGTGGNGCGALICARHLHGWGARVAVLVCRPDADFSPAPAHQLKTLRRLGVPIAGPGSTDRVDAPDLILDGLLSYGLRGAPLGGAADLIRWANQREAPILALDVPSGIDATTGEVHEPAIRAAATMALALPKRGLRGPAAKRHVGELYLADIGVPPSLYAEPSLGLEVGPIFARGEILRLR